MRQALVAALAEKNATRDPPLRITRLVCSFVLCRALEPKTLLLPVQHLLECVLFAIIVHVIHCKARFFYLIDLRDFFQIKGRGTKKKEIKKL